MKKKRIKTGFARVEFLALKGRIDELTEQGYLMTNIYEILRKEKLINFSYSRLAELMRESRTVNLTRVRAVQKEKEDSNKQQSEKAEKGERRKNNSQDSSFGKQEFKTDEII